MKKTKPRWLVMATVVALVIIAIPVIYYFFGRGNNKQEPVVREHYPWQQNVEIMKNSERFKSIHPTPDGFEGADTRMPEAHVLFSIIKVGMSEMEIRDLLGEPSRIKPNPMNNGNIYWYYKAGFSEYIIIEISNGQVVDKKAL